MPPRPTSELPRLSESSTPSQGRVRSPAQASVIRDMLNGSV